MAKKLYKQSCEGCGLPYEGRGKRFCSLRCSGASQTKIQTEVRQANTLDLFRPINIHVTPKKVSQAKRAEAFHSVHYGDIHFPFHDQRALNIRNQILDFLRPGIVVDHGDTGNCDAISAFPKDPFNRVSLGAEFQMMARDFGEVHAITPRAEHIWLEGNHEERLKRLVWNAAEKRDLAEVLTLDTVAEALTWDKLLGLDGLGWEVVPYPKAKLLFDRLVVVHGSTIRTHSAYSAKAEHDRYGKSGVSGHTHRRGSYYHTDFNGTNAWHELGMLGAIRSDYVAHANWQQGFGVVTWSEDRMRWGFEAVEIYDGMAFFRGMRFEG